MNTFLLKTHLNENDDLFGPMGAIAEGVRFKSHRIIIQWYPNYACLDENPENRGGSSYSHFDGLIDFDKFICLHGLYVMWREG